MIGTTLSHYRIVDELGRGGMGIVYRAEDTKLDRTVALKLLPASALASQDDRARFYREAKAAAQLNHPNIAAIHEIDEAVPEGGAKDEPRPFIAMEFIDGESLEDRVKAGPMPFKDAVQIAIQIGSALEAAHGKNIVHRDIKTANVMMTSRGDAKVLDFGLAKTAQSTQLTRMGSTMGTIAYMSPEQAKGEEVDGRADLWALGVVLYELITGRSPFGGDYEQAVVYSILNEDPTPPTAIRTGVPMGLEWIIAKLLAKKKEDRYQSATDLLVDLRTVDLTSVGLSRTSSVASMPAASVIAPKSKNDAFRPALFALAGVFVVALVWLVWPSSQQENPISPKRLVQPVPIGGVVAVVDISPQGDKVAFASDIIRVLDLSTGLIREYDIPGVWVHADFSKDGKDLLLTSSAGLVRLSLATGSSVHLFDTWEGGPRGEWATDDIIIYEERTSVWAASITSSEKRPVIVRDSLSGEEDVDFPHLLPDGKTVVGTAQFKNDVEKIGFWDLESGKNLGYLDYAARRVQWDPSGGLVFVQNGNAMYLPFDLKTLSPSGPLVTIDQNVQPEGLSVSNEGTLIHVGQATGRIQDLRPSFPVIARKLGQSMDFELDMETFPSAVYRSPSIHPNLNAAAIVIQGEPRVDGPVARDIWLLDFQNKTRRALTTDGNSDYPVWNATGDSLYYISNGQSDALMIMASTGRGGSRNVFEDLTPEFVDLDISPDGKWAVMAAGIPPSIDAGTAAALIDLTTGKLFGGESGSATASFETPGGNPRQFSFSPSSKYVAYEDQGAIYVQSMDDLNSTPVMLWANSMSLPQWAPDESMVYVVGVEDGVMHGVQVQTEPVFSPIGAPTAKAINETLRTLNVFRVIEADRFLVAYMDASAEVEKESEPTSIDLHVMVNMAKGLK